MEKIVTDPETPRDPAAPPRPRRERAVVLFADPAGALIRAGDEVLDEESLPVLTAFRQFLEAERRRARRQMVRLIALFGLVLAAAAVGGAWYLRTALGRMRQSLEADQARSEESRLAVASNLQHVARATATLNRDIQDTQKTAQTLQERMAAQGGDLARLLDTISTLEIQNALMDRAMRKLAAPPPHQPLEPRAAVAPPPFPEPDPVRAEPLPVPAPEPAAEPPPAPRVDGEPPAPRPAETAGGAAGLSPDGVPFRLSLPRE